MSEGTQPCGLLLAMMQQGQIPVAEVDAWYDLEHIPERLATPGFLTGQRFVNVEPAPRYLAIYDLQSRDVFSSAAYTALRDNPSAATRRILADAVSFRRNFYAQISPGRAAGPQGAGGLLLVELAGDPGARAEVRAWFETVYLPRCAAIGGVILSRCFHDLENDSNYLVLHHLESAAVAGHPDWVAALAAPGGHRLRTLARAVYRAPAAV